MNPNDYHILVFTLQDCFYYERCLPMGASNSCHIFDQIGIAMQWVMLNRQQDAGMSHI